MKNEFDFTQEAIHAMFGELAAEDERKERFASYFIKNSIYEKIHNTLPLRILVAHKGVGKSAIFRMSYLDNSQKGILSVWVKPDDIADVGKSEHGDTPLDQIRKWKAGLKHIVTQLIVDNFDLSISDEEINSVCKKGVGFLDALSNIIKPVKETIDFDPLKKKACELYLKNKNLVVYIDDLDRAWDGSKDNIQRIAALLNAVRDLANEMSGLCFRISLRSDVYFLVRTADESTDKIEGNVVWLGWTEHELLVLLVKRVQSYLGATLKENALLKKPQFELVKYLHPIMESHFQGDGKWNNREIHYIILSLVRKRPRDIINLCSLAASNAGSERREKIETHDWETIFSMYSQSRLQDTINEHRYELPDIERLLLGMKPSHEAKKQSGAFVFDKDKLIRKIEGIMQSGDFIFHSGVKADATQLIAFMYKIDFIVARKNASDGYIDRKYFEENKYLSTSFVDFGYEWEVHPAFRWALYPESRAVVEDIALTQRL